MNSDINDIPHKSLICGEYITSSGSHYCKKYLYQNISLPPLESPSCSDLENNIKHLHDAFKDRTWLDITAKKRVEIILRAASRLESLACQAAYYDAIESGRSLNSLIKDSIPKAVETIRWFCSALLCKYNKVYQSPDYTFDYAYTSDLPAGICLCILPWNDPLVLFAWKVIPALLMGNCVIVKPSEYSSGSALMFTKILIESGVPSNVISVIVGRNEEIFRSLILSPHIPIISMTGSTKTALYIQHTSSESEYLKKLNFECGGKSAFLITKNNSEISLIKGLKVVAENIYYNQGQICSAPSLLLCHVDHYKNALNQLKLLLQEYSPSDPLDKSTNIGTMCNESSVKRIQLFLQSATEIGGTVYQGALDDPKLINCALPPTLLILKKADYLKYSFLQQELFGPVLTVIFLETIEDMVAIANSSNYGLASSIWSESIHDVQFSSYHLNAGIVHVNSYGKDSVGLPFGGILNSGDAKEKCIETFDQFSYKKLVYTHLSLS